MRSSNFFDNISTREETFDTFARQKEKHLKASDAVFCAVSCMPKDTIMQFLSAQFECGEKNREYNFIRVPGTIVRI